MSFAHAIPFGILLATAAAGAQTSRAFDTDSLTIQEWTRLRTGRPVVKHDKVAVSGGEVAGHIRGFILSSASASEGFRALVQHERDPQWYGSCMKEAEVLSRTNTAGLEQERVRERHRSFGMTSRYTLDYTHDNTNAEIRWALDSTASNEMFSEYRGSWRFSAVNDSTTMIIYDLTARAHTWLPAFLQDYFINKRVPDFLIKTRRRVETPPVP